MCHPYNIKRRQIFKHRTPCTHRGMRMLGWGLLKPNLRDADPMPLKKQATLALCMSCRAGGCVVVSACRVLHLLLFAPQSLWVSRIALGVHVCHVPASIWDGVCLKFCSVYPIICSELMLWTVQPWHLCPWSLDGNASSNLQWSEDCFYYCSERNNVVVLFGTLKVQSFILTEVSDCGLLLSSHLLLFTKEKIC